MFSFLYSQEKKMRQNAANWLEVADRVYKFRRDQLTDDQNQRLLAAVGVVKQRLKDKADASKLKLSLESLEGVLRTVGGRIYPQGALVENVEFFLVAAIVILGLRAYFVQPFKIPTNSMWPTYYGMTSEVFAPGKEPNAVVRLARLATLGASNYTLKAPTDGEVMIPFFSDGTPAYSEKPGRSMFVFPTLMREQTLLVGGQPIQFSVPADWARSPEFGYTDAVVRTFFGGDQNGLGEAIRAAKATNRLETSIMRVERNGESADVRVYWVPTGRKVRAGETVMSFDILSGDLLFVDRLSYNFVRPSVGDGFVFKTGEIKSPEMVNATGGVSQYYVKRLVGTPGDTLEVRQPTLYRNGKPITGAAAFDQNARREGLYPGYTNNRNAPAIFETDGEREANFALPVGGTVNVPKHFFYAMGDNSPYSSDSRYWGFVPEKEVVGRPLFIYFPLTRRWGLAR